MNSDDKFWVIIWSFATAIVVSLVLTIGAYNCYQTFKIAEAISGGANPIEAKYAMSCTTMSEDALAWMVRKDNRPMQPDAK